MTDYKSIRKNTLTATLETIKTKLEEVNRLLLKATYGSNFRVIYTNDGFEYVAEVSGLEHSLKRIVIEELEGLKEKLETDLEVIEGCLSMG